MEGAVFNDMYIHPLPKGEDESTIDGSSVNTPLVLEGISLGHFRGFLRVLYRL